MKEIRGSWFIVGGSPLVNRSVLEPSYENALTG